MKTTKPTPKSDAAIAKLPPVTAPVLLPFGGSLYLRRLPRGRQTWLLRTRIGGAWRIQQLGDWPAVGLHLARQRAEAARADLAPASADSRVEQALEAFKREYLGVRYRTAAARKESGALLERALAGMAHRSLASVRRLDLTTAVQALAHHPRTATMTLSLVKQFTGWATARGLLEVDPLGGVTAGRLGLQPYAPRERILTPAELRALWGRDDPDARVLKFCLVTAARIGEALQWVPEQVAGEVPIWTIPITKSGRAHTVPLSPAAVALLPLPAVIYVSMAGRLKRSGCGWTPHDLRRTASTLMREAGVPVLDVEAVLGHAPPRLQRIYQRFDPVTEKRAALLRLAERVAEIVGGEQ
jgi:integrase